MHGRVVVDAGPLVALFDRDDRFHEDACRFVKSCRRELLTTLAVLTEVVYLLDFSLQAQTDFLTWVSRGALAIEDLSVAEMARVSELMKKYGDRPIDFADATLTVICERLSIRDVASIDAKGPPRA